MSWPNCRGRSSAEHGDRCAGITDVDLVLTLCLVADNHSAASAGKTACLAASAGKTACLVASHPKVVFDVGVFDASSIVGVLFVLLRALAVDELQECGRKIVV